jgi:hypothetical protein
MCSSLPSLRHPAGGRTYLPMTGSYFVQFIFLITQSHRWFIVTVVGDTLHQFTAFQVTRSRIYAIFVQMIGLISTSTDALHPFSVSLCVKIPELRLESICRGKLYLLIFGPFQTPPIDQYTIVLSHDCQPLFGLLLEFQEK